MDLQKRSLAPLTDSAWEAIREEATRTLKVNLSARRIVDVVGPHGPEFAAVNLGRLEVPKQQAVEGFRYGLRKVLPLVETRVQFEMEIWELDNAERGARDLDLHPVIQAAHKAARFEEQAIYSGFDAAGIVGLAKASAHKPVVLGKDLSKYPELAAKAVVVLKEANVTGPYTMVLGPGPYRQLESAGAGYPVSKRVERLLGGPILFAPFIEGGFLVSTRGGDFELALGQDFAIGYETTTTTKARLFLGESFTFRVLTPEAVVPLKA